MDVADALASRRMVRSFDGSPLEAGEVIELFTDALWAPTAGHSRGVRWIALVGTDELDAYFTAATDERWRSSAPRAPGLRRAGAAGVCVAQPQRYLERYRDADKATAGLGERPERWPVPYWIGDAGATTMAALLLAEERGLSAVFLGAFRQRDELASLLGIGGDEVLYGTVLLGHPDGQDRRSPSLGRPGPSRADRVTRVGLETPPHRAAPG